ncbi:MAG: hypothetical protein ROZ36_19165 [Thermincola sp.]|nr:hypothetical protein [Thermincola sp.]
MKHAEFLAFDFDGKDYSPEDLRRDVTAIREACTEKGICMAVERSRSGKGIHFWMFFAENIPTCTARKFWQQSDYPCYEQTS